MPRPWEDRRAGACAEEHQRPDRQPAHAPPRRRPAAGAQPRRGLQTAVLGTPVARSASRRAGGRANKKGHPVFKSETESGADNARENGRTK